MPKARVALQRQTLPFTRIFISQCFALLYDNNNLTIAILYQNLTPLLAIAILYQNLTPLLAIAITQPIPIILSF
ncbi:hypothetical protein [Limnofasciculus baicalensis]|uniref:Uncharacterized protein n=1 Tax=Limnofasciculus baicalensis BBK-W-15 TaxID=2699891 RepID=A0AAE3KQ62_9CYAN|nr:hypothetical protein [Limnofasciculus baicalensis]MCP2730363.1 hypothetical protein [Limnofasciculus baicalensis BBK-W-15]